MDIYCQFRLHRLYNDVHFNCDMFVTTRCLFVYLSSYNVTYPLNLPHQGVQRNIGPVHTTFAFLNIG